MSKHEIKSALTPIRVLDLTIGNIALGPRMLGDVGSDVIKIEPPGGCKSRIGPYYKNISDPQKSLPWFAYNFNKRGITLDIKKPEGQELFRKLAQTADVIIESQGTSFMDHLKIGYDDVTKLNKDIIYTSVTPFGKKGPKSQYSMSELTVWASGGFLNDCGDPDRAPVWIGYPQAGVFAGAESAVGTMTALWHRTNTGEGQFVDVSMQEAAVAPNMNVLQMWDVNKVEFKRVGAVSFVAATRVKQPIYFKSKDGFIMILALGGNEPYVSSSQHLVQWMKDEGMCPDWLSNLDWWKDYNAAVLTQEVADKVGQAIETFTLTKTKQELYEIGAFGKYKQILIAPVASTKDISEDVQLSARNYWVKMAHPELETSLPYCGPFIHMSESPIHFQRRAPLIGEHNREIYDEIGLNEGNLKALNAKGVI